MKRANRAAAAHLQAQDNRKVESVLEKRGPLSILQICFDLGWSIRGGRWGGEDRARIACNSSPRIALVEPAGMGKDGIRRGDRYGLVRPRATDDAGPKGD